MPLETDLINSPQSLDTVITHSTSSTTFTDVTELVSDSLDVGTYLLRINGLWQQTKRRRSIGIRLAGFTIGTCHIAWNIEFNPNGIDCFFKYSQTSPTDNIPATNSVFYNTDYGFNGKGVFTITTPGSVSIQIRVYGGYTASIRPGAIFKITKVG